MFDTRHANSSEPCYSNPLVNGGPRNRSWVVGAGGNCLGSPLAGLPNGITGVAFVELPRSSPTLALKFTAPGPPVWGDFYIAGGLQYVYNADNANYLNVNILNFAAVPGSPPPVAPEPKTLGLAAVALVLLGLMGKERRR